jgi:hypothetical protein
MKSDMETLSTAYVKHDIEGPNWSELREQQGWDDFLAWCRAQENGPHE